MPTVMLNAMLTVFCGVRNAQTFKRLFWFKFDKMFYLFKGVTSCIVHSSTSIVSWKIFRFCGCYAEKYDI